MLKVGTLFSGIGATEQALLALGIPHEVVFACDFDLLVKDTYLANHQCNIFYDNVLSIEHLPYADILVFGSPCQSFSFAGHRMGMDDPRGKLALHTLNLIETNLPGTVIFENVVGLAHCDGGKWLDYMLTRFRKMGYNVQWKILDARDFGVAQRRRRLFVVASMKEGFEFPDATGGHPPLNTFLSHNSDPSVYATVDFLQKPKVQRRLETYSNPHINCITHTISRKGSSAEYISYVAAVNYAIGETRIPTVPECCKLFGFPPDFKFPYNVSTTRRYNMIANSMVIPVIKSIISSVVSL